MFAELRKRICSDYQKYGSDPVAFSPFSGADPNSTAFLGKFESVQVTNSQVVLQSKSGTREK